MESEISQKLDKLHTLRTNTMEERRKINVDKIYSQSIDRLEMVKGYINRYKIYEEQLRSINHSPSESVQLNARKAIDLAAVLDKFVENKRQVSEDLERKVEQLNGFIRRLEKKREWMKKCTTSEQLENITLGTMVYIDPKLEWDAENMRNEWKEIEAKSEFLKKEGKTEVDKFFEPLDLNVDRDMVQLARPCKGEYSCTYL